MTDSYQDVICVGISHQYEKMQTDLLIKFYFLFDQILFLVHTVMHCLSLYILYT